MIKILLLLTSIAIVNGVYQEIEVKGQLQCKDKPISNLTVQLREEDIFSVNFLNETKTDKDGYFILSGGDYEYSRIDPFIEFTYTCPPNIKSSVHDKKIFYVPNDVFEIYRHYSSYYYDFGKLELSRILKRINFT
uniref:Transthyretin-like family-containing protein n=1 Tax=Parastrongyloides trichosuri TaxID=131310 RepID=A0A0N5A5F8_PARTI